jgi:hypothetical protein
MLELADLSLGVRELDFSDHDPLFHLLVLVPQQRQLVLEAREALADHLRLRKHDE